MWSRVIHNFEILWKNFCYILLSSFLILAEPSKNVLCYFNFTHKLEAATLPGKKQVPKADEAALTVDAAGRCCVQLSDAFHIFEHFIKFQHFFDT